MRNNDLQQGMGGNTRWKSEIIAPTCHALKQSFKFNINITSNMSHWPRKCLCSQFSKFKKKRLLCGVWRKTFVFHLLWDFEKSATGIFSRPMAHIMQPAGNRTTRYCATPWQAVTCTIQSVTYIVGDWLKEFHHLGMSAPLCHINGRLSILSNHKSTSMPKQTRQRCSQKAEQHLLLRVQCPWQEQLLSKVTRTRLFRI